MGSRNSFSKFKSGHKLRAGIAVALLFWVALFAAGASAAVNAGPDKAPPAVLEGIIANQPQEVVVLFDDTDIENDAASMRDQIGSSFDTQDILAMKAGRFRALKQTVESALPSGEFDVLQDYTHLPMTFIRVNTPAAMAALLQKSDVVRVYENTKYYSVATSNLALINQPQVQAMNMTGVGTTVAVLDNGIDLTQPAFGTCTGASTPGLCTDTNPPAAPAGCSIACTRTFGTGGTVLHGTNVAGIVLAVAPGTKVAALDVFSGNSASGADIVNAINWAIANKTAYNIMAMNLSLGDSSLNTTTCPSNFFASPVANARNAGILAAIAAGNDHYSNGLSSPACVPTAVSVGAVYWGNSPPSVSYQNCSDPVTAADLVTCFSNSASYLTLLAPGANITAAGQTFYGTSQATPHIAGSIAVLRGQGAFPGDSVTQTVTRMTSTGVLDTDPKSGFTTPRIDLLAATAGAPPTTFSITGTIRTPGTGFGSGMPISGVTVTLSGAASTSTTTNPSGVYTFSSLANGNYTVTPSLSGYAFSPTNRAVTVNNANVTGQDFTGTAGAVTFSITGTITSGGSPLAGVTVALTGTAAGSTTTNASGVYTFSGLSNGGYTVTPSMAGFTFTPPNRAVTVSSANVTGQDFTATAVPSTFSITGTITSGGSPLAGVTVALSGAATASTTTNASGVYTFSGLSNGGYTVTPSMAGFTFTPPNRAVTVSSANVTGQDFTGTPTATFSITGTIKTPGSGFSGGMPISGVTVALSGAATASTMTNASGVYTFSGLANGGYTVTPSLGGYSFSPVNRAVTVNNANVTGQDFTGTAGAVTFSITGTITSGASPLAGVTVALTGAAAGSTTTNASGVYTFSGLANGGYTVTPSMAGFTFTPPNRAVTVSSANVTGQDFTATAVPSTFSITGTITSGGSPLAGVTVALSGAATASTTTNALGVYTFSGLSNGGYTVTPSMGGFTFTPVNRAVTVSGANVTGQDFTATAVPSTFSITGTIRTVGGFGGSMPVAGVTVALSGAATASTTTNASGVYTFSGLSNGGYTVTPSLGGFTFTPPNRAVTVNNANVTGQDFTRFP